MISRANFRELIYLMNLFDMDHNSPEKRPLESSWFKLTSAETEHLIETLDPHKTDNLIYSEVVKVFTSPTFTIKHLPLDGSSEMDLTILEKYITNCMELSLIHI